MTDAELAALIALLQAEDVEEPWTGTGGLFARAAAALRELQAMRAETRWRPPDTAPTDRSPFLAILSNDWHSILWATEGVHNGWRYSWWGGGTISVPYEPSHPADYEWKETTPRIVGWLPLPSPPQEQPA